MTSPSPQDEKGPKEDFKQVLKVWLKENGFTQKELGLHLGVTYGTVRNWFSSDSSISEKYMERIKDLMSDPAAYRGALRNMENLTCLNIHPFKANMPLWRSAAMVKDVYFQADKPRGRDAVQFAQWSTPIINRAINQELKKLDAKAIREFASEVHFGFDPVCRAESMPDNIYAMTPEESERMDLGIPICLPVMQGAINTLFLGIAAKAAKKDIDDFIADALNAEANSDFEETIRQYLKQNDDDDAMPVPELAPTLPSAPAPAPKPAPKRAPAQPKPDDDIPF